MRFPVSKVYRGFPELDKFSDEQCATYVRIAEQANLLSCMAVQAIVLIMFLPGSCGGGVLMYWVVGFLFRDREETEWTLLATLLLMLFGVVAPGVGGLTVRDAWLRRMVRRQLERCLCPICRYSLLGLRPANGSVVCPECGTTHELESMGLEPVDILAPLLVSDSVFADGKS